MKMASLLLALSITGLQKANGMSSGDVHCNSATSIWEHLPRASKVLGDPDPEIRVRNTMCLEKFGIDAAPILIKALSDKHWAERALAANMLAGFGAEAHKAIPALVKIANDPEVLVRRAVLDAILVIDPKSEYFKKTLPVFRQALRDSDKEVSRRGSAGLLKISRNQPEEFKKTGISITTR